jgi:hypothetical protein
VPSRSPSCSASTSVVSASRTARPGARSA